MREIRKEKAQVLEFIMETMPYTEGDLLRKDVVEVYEIMKRAQAKQEELRKMHEQRMKEQQK